MRTVFVSTFAEPMERWLQAFPQLSLFTSVDQCLCLPAAEKAMCFLDVAGFATDDIPGLIRTMSEAGLLVVAMSSNPDDQEAFNMVVAGARGYCHAAASPERLREVASAVSSGQLWLPSGIIQNFISLTQKTGGQGAAGQRSSAFDQLTEREYEVAAAVGRGANNKEIAEQLAVSERTVKAHLTSCFEKLGLRDRVQLALAVNRLPHNNQ